MPIQLYDSDFEINEAVECICLSQSGTEVSLRESLGCLYPFWCVCCRSFISPSSSFGEGGNLIFLSCARERPDLAFSLGF